MVASSRYTSRSVHPALAVSRVRATASPLISLARRRYAISAGDLISRSRQSSAPASTRRAPGTCRSRAWRSDTGMPSRCPTPSSHPIVPLARPRSARTPASFLHSGLDEGDEGANVLDERRHAGDARFRRDGDEGRLSVPGEHHERRAEPVEPHLARMAAQVAVVQPPR